MLLSFSNVYLKRNFDEPVPTPKAHLEWWGYCCLDRRRVALAAPRGHAKSTAITHTYVLASICLRIKRHCLIISDTEGQASMFLGNIAKELRENEDLKMTFGFDRFLKDNETELIIRWTDGTRTRISAHGAGQKIRGTNWHGYRPDLIICDDLENDEAVMNDERRDKFSRWFLNTLIPIGGKFCDIRVVGTILHENSLLAQLMPNVLEDKNCVVTPLKITTTTPRAFLGVLYRAHPDFDDFSEILWPEQWDEERLKEARQAYIDQGKPEGYAQEYLNTPTGGDGAYFHEEDLIPISLEELMKETRSPETFLIGVDLAISKASRRAYSVFMVAGVDQTGCIRIREVIRRRMDSLEICETLFSMHEKYRLASAMNHEPIFLVENENIAKSIGPFLYREMDERNQYPILEKMPPINDKELRARAIQGRIRAGMVEFNHEADWWPTLKHEMVTFPRATYLDQVDALAWIGHHLAKMHTAPSWEEVDEELYEEEYAEAQATWGEGRNSFTGY